MQAINKVIEDFKLGIKTKNTRLLSSQLLNSNILFEAWQMLKVAEGKWKIASVMWTMNRPPK